MRVNLEENFVTVSSRRVSTMVDRRHDHLLRDIDVMVKYLKADKSIDVSKYFIESTYLDAQKHSRRSYELTEKGCDLYVVKMTGQKGILFAVKYKEYFEVIGKQRKLPLDLELAQRKIKDLEEEIEELLTLTTEASKRKALLHKEIQDITRQRNDLIEERNEFKLEIAELRNVIKVLSTKI